MNLSAIIAALRGAKDAILIGIALVLLAAVGVQTWRLSSTKADYRAYQDKMIAITAIAKEKTRAAQVAITFSLKEYSRESDFAAERARMGIENAERDAAKRIADLRRTGDDRVRDTWRQCLSRPSDGNSAAVAEGPPALSDDGAKAIEPVLAIGRSADVYYARAITELKLTRGLLATCYRDSSAK